MQIVRRKLSAYTFTELTGKPHMVADFEGRAEGERILDHVRNALTRHLRAPGQPLDAWTSWALVELRGAAPVLVLRDGQGLAGGIASGYLWVRPDLRGRGYGARLVQIGYELPERPAIDLRHTPYTRAGLAAVRAAHRAARAARRRPAAAPAGCVGQLQAA